jgi:putative transcriptional regulator
MKVKSHLAKLMESAGVDQKTLAMETGLSPATVGKLYRGHFNRIDNHTVTVLCKWFRLSSIAELIEIVWEPEDGEAPSDCHS